MPREHKIINALTDEPLVDKSNTGREVVTAICGNWGTASLEIRTLVPVADELSDIIIFPGIAAQTADFSTVVNVGFRNPLYVTVTGIPVDPIYLKASPLNVG